jgi:hypothetical protein
VKPTDHHVEGSWLVTELRGDLVHGAILDEESSQRFIVTLKGQLGLKEEATAGLTIHGAGSHQLTVFCPPQSPSLPAAVTAGKATTEAWRTRFAGESHDLTARGLPGPVGFRKLDRRPTHAKIN